MKDIKISWNMLKFIWVIGLLVAVVPLAFNDLRFVAIGGVIVMIGSILFIP